MNRKRAQLLVTSAVLGLVAVLLYMNFRPTKSHEATIAIFTTLSHPALNSVREGFMEQMAKNEGAKVTFKDFNAEANMQQANMLARQITETDNLLGIVAIGTLAAQTMAKVDKKTPIIIAAVSDLKAVTTQSSSNLCGLSDSIDADFQINTLMELLPHLKSISFLYSPHEDNSSAMVRKLQASAEKRGLSVNLVGVS
jgi:putative ABC transport system substrate-binding protein